MISTELGPTSKVFLMLSKVEYVNSKPLSGAIFTKVCFIGMNIEVLKTDKVSLIELTGSGDVDVCTAT